MGSRSSKHSPKSYDFAPVVSDKDFSYTRSPRPLPEVALPAPNENQQEEHENYVKASNLQNNTVNDTPTAKEKNIAVAECEIEQPEVPTTKKDACPTTPSIPIWVNEDNFKPVLLKSYPNFKEVISFEAFPALAAGENYATLMLRVKISIRLQDATTTDVSYMLKVAHDNKEMKEMLQHLNFFNTENAVYQDAIPEIEQMYARAGVTVEIGPKSHRLAEDAPAAYYVLLDDLSVRGFKNANRLECLDMEHTLAVLKKLAQFHAASACRVGTEGPYAEVFSPNLDNEMVRGMMKQMFGALKQPFLDNLPKFENGQLYVEKMDKFFDHCVDLLINFRKKRPDYFNALNHADAWCNNILFSYAPDGKLNEVMFVDFQNTHYGSVAYDLLYFIISSARIDIKTSKFDYFIRHYHQHLVENLKLLAYPGEIPNLRELHMQLLEFGAWATFTSFLTMGIVLLDPTDNAKFENFMAESEEGLEFKHKIYSNPRYIKYINELMPWLYNRGFMDVNDLDSQASATDKAAVATPTNAVNVADDSEQRDFAWPEWVNEAYFIDIIRSDFESYQRILKFVVSPATSAGDNYSSTMLKVDIDIELADKSRHSLSYMLKIPPAGAEAQAVISSLSSFVKEIRAYNEVLPLFEQAYKSQADIDVVFGPKSYKPPNAGDGDTLILENLKIKGFKNCDRLEGLDMNHTKAVLKKLAQFHAASAYVCATKGKLPAVYENSIYTEEFRKARGDSSAEFYNIYYDCVKEFNGTEEYIDDLKKFLDNSFDIMMQAHKIDETKFNVLNHGDCWTNNIMFQHDETGAITNTYFVDYQLMKYGTPAYDLYYFLLTSCKFDLKLQNFDYFIRHYHENLKSCLELLKYPKHIPTLRELHVELLDQGAWAMYAVVAPMAVILLDPTDNASLELMMKADESGKAFRKKIFSHQRYRLHAEALYPWMSQRGLLTVNLPSDKSLTPPTDCEKTLLPSWLHVEHFADILRHEFHNFDKILNINVKSATNPGDNYASSLLRIKLDVCLKDGSTPSKSFILKLQTESEHDQGITSIWNFYEKESQMYSKYLREFENLYAQAGAKYELGPKYYKLDKAVDRNILLMADLGLRGFKCGNRYQGLDMPHSKCVLQKLAQFHAASAKYVEINGPFPAVFYKGLYSEESRAFFENMKFEYYYDYIKKYENIEQYIDKIPNLIENFTDNGIRNSQVDPNEFNVLNHGDLWVNNIVFQHNEEGEIEETIFVDYQVCKYGSPALDLWYFLLSSTELEIKVESFDHLVGYYHEHLVENLKLLKYNGAIPTLEDLHKNLLKYGNIGYSTLMGVTAICLLECHENANMANFAASTPEGFNFRDNLFFGDRFRAHAAIVLPWLAQRGCLN